MNAQTITCLNGDFVNAADACIPVADRGFRFGDGVFETIRLENGKPYQVDLHLKRLNGGLEALRITPPNVDWQSVINEMIAHNHATNGYLRIAVSRGVGSQGYLPNADIEATWLVEYVPAAPMQEHPYKLWVSSIQRAPLCALPSNFKLAQGISSTLALLDARDNGCDDALMLSSAGHLCETASANLFWVSGGNLYTPALSTGCLAGTTRDAILRLSPLPVQEVTVEVDVLSTADAVFVSNTRLGIWPVSTLVPEGWSYDSVHSCIIELTQRLNDERLRA